MPIEQADPSSLAQFLQPGMGGIDFSQFGEAEMTPQLPGMAALQPASAQPAQPKPSGGFRDFLGKLGDVLLLANDLPPMYLPMQQQREVEARQAEQQRALGEAMAQFVGQHPQFAGAAGVMQADPEIGMSLLKFLQPPDSQKPTSFMQEAGWLGLSPDQARPIWTERQTRPVQIVGSPSTGYSFIDDGGPSTPPGDDMPHVATPTEAMALPPGSQFIMPDGRIGTVPGGAGGDASGGFPGY